MIEGYLIVKCKRCGSVSQVTASSYRSKWSLCPVCMEGITERHYEKPSVRPIKTSIKHLQALQSHEVDNLRFRHN